MKKLFRKIIGYMVVLPFVVASKFLSIFLGQGKALNRLGMSKLSAYVCEADWAIARDNAVKWKFERNYQIGTGDSYCDHTYKRIQ